VVSGGEAEVRAGRVERDAALARVAADVGARRPPWMLAMVAVVSAAGSASLQSLPRVFMRVRPSRRCASQRSRPAVIAGSLEALHRLGVADAT